MSEPKPMNELFATMDAYTGHIPCFLLSAGFLHISISKSSIYIVLISWNDNRYYLKKIFLILTIANYQPDTILSDPQTPFV